MGTGCSARAAPSCEFSLLLVGDWCCCPFLNPPDCRLRPGFRLDAYLNLFGTLTLALQPPASSEQSLRASCGRGHPESVELLWLVWLFQTVLRDPWSAGADAGAAGLPADRAAAAGDEIMQQQASQVATQAVAQSVPRGRRRLTRLPTNRSGGQSGGFRVGGLLGAHGTPGWVCCSKSLLLLCGRFRNGLLGWMGWRLAAGADGPTFFPAVRCWTTRTARLAVQPLAACWK
jgi:hypothetical protein